MTEQICPHCDRVITQKDLDGYPVKMREREIREKYRSSIGHKRYNNLLATSLVWMLPLFLTTLLFLLFGYDIYKGIKPYHHVLFYLQIIFVVIAGFRFLYGYTIKLPNLENEYVDSRLNIQ